MSTTPKVSVIVPTYNVEEYLREALDSLVKQTLAELEIVIVNDGSTDGSLAIAQEYAARDERIRIISKENGGYGVAMNTGIDAATGEYIGILEPDDFVKLSMFKDLYEIASANDLDFVKADFYRFTRNDENGDMFCAYNHIDRTGEWYGTVFDPSHEPFALRFIMNTWSGIYKRSFLNEFDIRHNTTPGASFQDNGFWFMTFTHARRAMIVDEPYYMNRRDNPNSSVSNPGKVYASNREYDYIKGKLMEEPEVWERFKGMFMLKRYHNYSFTMKRIADEYLPEYARSIAQEFSDAIAAGEVDRSVFKQDEWDDFNSIIKDPGGYADRILTRRRHDQHPGLARRAWRKLKS